MANPNGRPLKANPYKKVIRFKITEETARRLTNYCNANKTTLTALLRGFVENLVKQK